MIAIQETPDGAVLAVKVVPGASRERIVGPLGDALKVAVRKPPERGEANKAVCALLADALGLRPADVQVLRGAGRARKSVLARGLSAEEARRRLGPAGA